MGSHLTNSHIQRICQASNIFKKYINSSKLPKKYYKRNFHSGGMSECLFFRMISFFQNDNIHLSEIFTTILLYERSEFLEIPTLSLVLSTIKKEQLY